MSNQDNQANLMDKVKLCSFDGCNRRAMAKGLCRAHYRQQAQGKDLKPIRAYRKKIKEIKETKELKYFVGVEYRQDRNHVVITARPIDKSMQPLVTILAPSEKYRNKFHIVKQFREIMYVEPTEWIKVGTSFYYFLHNLAKYSSIHMDDSLIKQLGITDKLPEPPESPESPEPLKEHEPSNPVPLHSVTSVEPDTVIQSAHGRIRQSLKGLRKGLAWIKGI